MRGLLMPTDGYPCHQCGGDGEFEDSPIPTPQGPHYRVSKCRACGGAGKLSAREYVELGEPDEGDDPFYWEALGEVCRADSRAAYERAKLEPLGSGNINDDCPF